MHIVVETPQYLKASESIFTEAERADIVSMGAADPECGDVMEGTGGFRKVRVGRGGMGTWRSAVDLHPSKRRIPNLRHHRLCEE
jgi:hypothetical protein